MAQHELSRMPPDGTPAGAAAEFSGEFSGQAPALGGIDAVNETAMDPHLQTEAAGLSATDANEQQQIQREIEAIARAIETLRKAEPALEQWTNAPPSALPPRQFWVLVGAVWLSTAAITLGAAIVASSLAG